jgi:hypothetical protein
MPRRPTRARDIGLVQRLSAREDHLRPARSRASSSLEGAEARCIAMRPYRGGGAGIGRGRMAIRPDRRCHHGAPGREGDTPPRMGGFGTRFAVSSNGAANRVSIWATRPSERRNRDVICAAGRPRQEIAARFSERSRLIREIAGRFPAPGRSERKIASRYRRSSGSSRKSRRMSRRAHGRALAVRPYPPLSPLSRSM